MFDPQSRRCDESRVRRKIDVSPPQSTAKAGPCFAYWVVVAGLLLVCGCREELPPAPIDDDSTGESTSHAPPLNLDRHANLKDCSILLVHSYHRGYRWVDTISEGVRSVVDKTGVKLDILYMDAKRHTDEAWKITAGRQASEWVDKHRPDIILAADDDAQEYFAVQYVNTGLPIVFTGVDADPSKYGYPAANATGVIECPHFKESLALRGSSAPSGELPS